MSSSEIVPYQPEISEAGKLLTAIAELKHQIIIRALYPGKKGIPISPDSSKSVLITSDGKDDGEFISLFVDGSWGKKAGKVPMRRTAILPPSILETWAQMRDEGFQQLTKTLWDEYEQICDSFDNGWMREYDFFQLEMASEQKALLQKRQYLEEHSLSHMNGLHDDLNLAVELIRI